VLQDHTVIDEDHQNSMLTENTIVEAAAAPSPVLHRSGELHYPSPCTAPPPHRAQAGGEDRTDIRPSPRWWQARHRAAPGMRTCGDHALRARPRRRFGLIWWSSSAILKSSRNSYNLLEFIENKLKLRKI
jgi:hypothetical protein